jgi:hypothetical protein
MFWYLSVPPPLLQSSISTANYLGKLGLGNLFLRETYGCVHCFFLTCQLTDFWGYNHERFARAIQECQRCSALYFLQLQGSSKPDRPRFSD